VGCVGTVPYREGRLRMRSAAEDGCCCGSRAPRPGPYCLVPRKQHACDDTGRDGINALPNLSRTNTATAAPGHPNRKTSGAFALTGPVTGALRRRSHRPCCAAGGQLLLSRRGPFRTYPGFVCCCDFQSARLRKHRAVGRLSSAQRSASQRWVWSNSSSREIPLTSSGLQAGVFDNLSAARRDLCLAAFERPARGNNGTNTPVCQSQSHRKSHRFAVRTRIA
jgi:hypothetical protein